MYEVHTVHLPVQVVFPRMETEHRGTELASEGLAQGGAANGQKVKARQSETGQRQDLRAPARLAGVNSDKGRSGHRATVEKACSRFH